MAGKKHLIIGAGSAGLNGAERDQADQRGDTITIVSAR